MSSSRNQRTAICPRVLLPFRSLVIFTVYSLYYPTSPFKNFPLHLRIFNFPSVLVSSASVAHEIFTVHVCTTSKSHGQPPVDESLLFGSFSLLATPYGDYWKYLRKLVAIKLLGPQALQRLQGTRTDELERFHVDLLAKAKKNETVEIVKEAIKLTNNTVCKMIMGRSCSEENGEAEKARALVLESFGLLKKFVFAQMFRKPLEMLRISVFKKEIMGLSNGFNELLERILVEHEEKPENHQSMDMMDVLLAAYRDENAEYKITRNHIKSLSVVNPPFTLCIHLESNTI